MILKIRMIHYMFAIDYKYKAIRFQAPSSTIFCLVIPPPPTGYVNFRIFARRILKAKGSFITSFMFILNIKSAIKIMTVNIIITQAIKLPSV